MRHAVTKEYREFLGEIGVKPEAYGGKAYAARTVHEAMKERTFDTVENFLEHARGQGFYEWAVKKGYKKAEPIILDPFLAMNDRALKSVKAISAARWFKDLEGYARDASEELIEQGWTIPANIYFRGLVRMAPTAAEVRATQGLVGRIGDMLKGVKVDVGAKVDPKDVGEIASAFSRLRPEDLGYRVVQARNGRVHVLKGVQGKWARVAGPFSNQRAAAEAMSATWAREGVEHLQRTTPDLFQRTPVVEVLRSQDVHKELTNSLMGRLAETDLRTRLLPPELVTEIDRLLPILRDESVI